MLPSHDICQIRGFVSHFVVRHLSSISPHATGLKKSKQVRRNKGCNDLFGTSLEKFNPNQSRRAKSYENYTGAHPALEGRFPGLESEALFLDTSQ